MGISASAVFLLSAWVALAVFARDLLGFFRKWRKRMTVEEREALSAPLRFNRDAVALQSAVLRDLHADMVYKNKELARRDGMILKLEQENAALRSELQELCEAPGQLRAQRHKGEQS